MLVPEVNGKSTSQLKAQAQDFEAQNYIDPLQNLLAAKAFVFHGLVDPIVRKSLTFYTHIAGLEFECYYWADYSEGEQAYELHKAFGVDTRMETLNDCSHGVVKYTCQMTLKFLYNWYTLIYEFSADR